MTPSDTFRGKYRTESTRKPMFDYGWNAMYFVTMCTKNRTPFFGTIDGDCRNIAHAESMRVPVETQNLASLPDPGNIVDPRNKPDSKDNGPYVFIDHTRMNTTSIGEMARQCWAAIPNHFPFVRLDAFVVMPNHIHGIIIIDKNTEDDDHYIDMDLPGNKPGPQSQNIGSIIRGFKIGVTKFTNDNNLDFAWQPRFHDSIIADAKSLDTVRRYIASNPMR